MDHQQRLERLARLTVEVRANVEISGRAPGGAWVPILRDNEFQVS